MTRPELLIDYLTDAYNAGGIISLLALSSLFTLIRKHNLDYPEFYPKLYSLLDSRVLHISYRRRFLRLLDLFMQSTMLPAAVVAAFAKRVARLALWAPAPSVQWVVPFVYNLLKKHPACRVMIHRQDADALETDPYDAADPNPATCGALSSSLWELQTLTRHHWGPVARQAGIFSERFTKPPMDLGKVLDEAPFTYAEVIEAELAHRWSKRPPTALDIPAEAFD
jgi:U3 small nucleolar RNA-associated protein 19